MVDVEVRVYTIICAQRVLVEKVNINVEGQADEDHYRAKVNQGGRYC